MLHIFIYYDGILNPYIGSLMSKKSIALVCLAAIMATACVSNKPKMAAGNTVQESELQNIRFYKQSPAFLAQVNYKGEQLYWYIVYAGDLIFKLNGAYYNAKDIKTLTAENNQVAIELNDGNKVSAPRGSSQVLFSDPYKVIMPLNKTPYYPQIERVSTYAKMPSSYEELQANRKSWKSDPSNWHTELYNALVQLNAPGLKFSFMNSEDTKQLAALHYEVDKKSKDLLFAQRKIEQTQFEQKEKVAYQQKLANINRPSKGTEEYCGGDVNFSNVYECNTFGRVTHEEMTAAGWIVVNRMPRTVLVNINEQRTINDVLLRKNR